MSSWDPEETEIARLYEKVDEARRALAQARKELKSASQKTYLDLQEMGLSSRAHAQRMEGVSDSELRRLKSDGEKEGWRELSLEKYEKIDAYCEKRLKRSFGLAELRKRMDRAKKALDAARLNLHNATESQADPAVIKRKADDLLRMAREEDRGGAVASAAALREQRLLLLQDVHLPDHPEILEARLTLAQTHERAGRYSDAIRYGEELISDRRPPRERVPARIVYAKALDGMGRYADADHYWRELVPVDESSQATLPQHDGLSWAETLSLGVDRVRGLRLRGRLDEADRLLKAVLAHRGKPLDDPEASRALLRGRAEQGMLALLRGRVREARSVTEGVVASYRNMNLERDLDSLAAQVAQAESWGPYSLKEIFIPSGAKWKEVPALLRPVRQQLKESCGESSALTVGAAVSLIRSCPDKGEQARQTAVAVEAEARAWLGERHPHRLLALNELGATYLRNGRAAEALDMFQQSYDLQRDVLGAEHPHTLKAQLDLGVTLLVEEKGSRGKQLITEAKTGLVRVTGIRNEMAFRAVATACLVRLLPRAYMKGFAKLMTMMLEK